MRKPTELPDLLPCPFCGGPVQLEEAHKQNSPEYGERQFWGVVCRNTTNLGGTCCMEQVPSASPEAAIGRWNSRAKPKGESGSAVWELLNELYRLNPTPEAQALIKKIDRKLEIAVAALGKPEGEAQSPRCDPSVGFFVSNESCNCAECKPEGEGPQAEPVGEVKLGAHGKLIDWYSNEFDLFAMPVGTKLYTTPAAQHAESGAQAIPTWQERSGMREFMMPKDAAPHMVAEIRDLRAALAAQSQGAQAVAWAVVVGENMANTVHLTVDAEEAQCEYEASVAGGFESVYNLVPLYRSAQQAAAPGAKLVAPDNLPRWIDDLKGNDPTIDSLIEFIIKERAASPVVREQSEESAKSTDGQGGAA